nr:TadE family type IV pilus minor pilin [Leifsonia psychrotolerans]
MTQPHERGSITAEFAVVLPAVVLVLACCLAAIQVVGQQVRLTDAAVVAARMLGRGESLDSAAAAVQASIAGAELRTEHQGDLVCALLQKPSGFGPFARAGVTVTARSCAPSGGL